MLLLVGCSYPRLVDEGKVDVAYLQRISEGVAQLRELPLDAPVPHRLLTEEQVRTRFRRVVDELDEAEVEAQRKALVAFGLASADLDLRELVAALYAEQTAAFYDSKEETFFLIDRELAGGLSGTLVSWMLQRDIMGEFVAAHELLHALQDRRYDLEAFLEAEDLDDDERLARRALVEGDATYWGMAFSLRGMSASMNDIEVPREDLVASADGEAFARAPRLLQEQLLFPYLDGLAFIQELSGLSETVWARPPRSTEQVLHPERYLDDDLPLVVRLVAPLPGGWDLVHEETLGELGLRALLARDEELEREARERAARGWGGDRYRVLERRRDEALAPDLAVVWAVEMDSERDARELAGALRGALAAEPARAHQITRVGERGLAVVIATDPAAVNTLMVAARERRVAKAGGRRSSRRSLPRKK